MGVMMDEKLMEVFISRLKGRGGGGVGGGGTACCGMVVGRVLHLLLL